MIASLTSPVHYSRAATLNLLGLVLIAVVAAFLFLCLAAICSGLIERRRRSKRHGLNRKTRHIGRKP